MLKRAESYSCSKVSCLSSVFLLFCPLYSIVSSRLLRAKVERRHSEGITKVERLFFGACLRLWKDKGKCNENPDGNGNRNREISNVFFAYELLSVFGFWVMPYFARKTVDIIWLKMLFLLLCRLVSESQSSGCQSLSLDLFQIPYYYVGCRT